MDNHFDARGTPGLEAQRTWLQRHIVTLVLVALTLLVGVGLVSLIEHQPTISDPLSYLQAGQSLARLEGPTYHDPQNLVPAPFFNMYGFQVARDDPHAMYLGYPPGFSLLLGAAVTLFNSPHAADYVNPALTAAALLLTYWVALLLLRNQYVALLSVALLALTPMLWTFGTSPWSEIPATALGLSGMGLFLWSRTSHATSRLRAVAGLAAGLLLGYSFFVRYTNVVLVIPLFAYELQTAGAQIWTEKWRWPAYGALAVTLIAVPLFNLVYYGGLFTTSYSTEHGWYAQAPFALAYAFGPSFVDGYSLWHALETLWRSFPVVLLLVPLGLWLAGRIAGLFLFLAIMGTLGIYSLYAFAPTGINSRFLLPMLPFVAIAIAVALHRLLVRLPWPALAVAIAVLLLAARATLVPDHLRSLVERDRASNAKVDFIRQVAASLPDGAVVLSYELNDLLAYYGTMSVLSYRRIPPPDPNTGGYYLSALTPCLVETIDGLLASDTPVFYAPLDPDAFWEVSDILQANYTTAPHQSPLPLLELTGTLPSRADQPSSCLDELEAARVD